ncbi:MAG: aminotransferase class V-fold PLP-dependent enzyme [Rubrivivax sp.]
MPAIATLLHRFGALSFWDFAAAAPYVRIDMGQRHGGSLAYLDAAFVSPHKFIGGPGTPGLLVARRELFRNCVPSVPGAGTVAYVNPAEHRYLADIESRTPAIVESIRAGLVFQLKEAVGVEAIREREESFIRRAIERWGRHPDIEILGSRSLKRLSIVSFVVRHRHARRPPSLSAPQLRRRAAERPLRHPGARRLLVRGAARASPARHRPERRARSSARSRRGCEGIKPGGRASTSTTSSARRCSVYLRAVEMVASDGWRLLLRYRFDPMTGLWKTRRAGPVPMSLRDITYRDGRMNWSQQRHSEPESALAGYPSRRHASWPRSPSRWTVHTAAQWTPTSSSRAGSPSRTVAPPPAAPRTRTRTRTPSMDAR